MTNETHTFWKGFAILLILLNLGLLSFIFFTSTKKHGPGYRNDGGPAKMLIEELKLTPAQVANFNQLKEAHHDSIQKLNQAGRRLRESYFDGLKTDLPSSAQDSLLNLIVDNQRKKEVVTYDHFTEVKKLCNPEQQVIFNHIIQDALKQLKPPPPSDRP